MKAKKDTYVLRGYYQYNNVIPEWRVGGFDMRTMFYSDNRPPPYLARNLKLEYNIIAGGDILSLNDIEIYNCDLYKARG